MTRSRRRSRKRGERPSGVHGSDPGLTTRAEARQPAGDVEGDVENEDLRVVEEGRGNMYTVHSVKIEQAEAPERPAIVAQKDQAKVVAERINVDGGEGVVIFRTATTTRCSRYMLKEVFE
jgi:hypothetical protein